MRIKYFNRQQAGRYSIEKVTNSIVQEISQNNEVQSLMVPELKANLFTIIRNIRFVHKNRLKSGINHVTGDIHYCILGLINCKSVLTVHDTVFLTTQQNKIIYFIKWLLWLYLPCLFADKIICISQKTKQELIKHHISASKITVIYDPVSLPKVEKKEKKHPKIKVLHIGTKPNKNLFRVIKALEKIECELTIVGKLSKEQITQLDNSEIDYRNLCDISENDLASEYYGADIISFPSLYEGFGMPIIEGQLANCVVLTSNIPPMSEIGKDTVMLVNPLDINSIRKGFMMLIENETLRNKLIGKGKINAQRFSPKQIAKEYLELYKTL